MTKISKTQGRVCESRLVVVALWSCCCTLVIVNLQSSEELDTDTEFEPAEDNMTIDNRSRCEYA